MGESKKQKQQDYAELTRQIDALLETSAPREDFDLNDYSPADTDEDGVLFENFSNGYGKKLPNFANGFQPEESSIPQKSAIPAYNADLQQPQSIAQQHASGFRPKGGCCGCGCLGLLALVLAVVIGLGALLTSYVKMPQSTESLGARKPGVSTVLLCGTDKDGTRTDTMMLIYLDTNAQRVGLLSLPRDTMTRTDAGKLAKLNAAYGRNGCGPEGMDWVMEYVRRTIGYRPDGYILVDMELVPKVVDLMGGVEVYLDHHIRVHTDGVEVYVGKGQQHMNGEQTLAALRYRYGYADADLGRVKVQRKIIRACMEQWVRPEKLELFPAVMDLIEEESLTDLEMGNYLWVAQAILRGMDNMTSDTLPGKAKMRNGASYYILDPQGVADLINASYNPYARDLTLEDLTIAE